NVLRTSAYRRYNRNLTVRFDARPKLPREPHVLSSNEYVDVLPNLALFGHNSITQSGMQFPKRREGCPQVRSLLFKFDDRLSSSEWRRGPRYKKPPRHTTSAPSSAFAPGPFSIRQLGPGNGALFCSCWPSGSTPAAEPFPAAWLFAPALVHRSSPS